MTSKDKKTTFIAVTPALMAPVIVVLARNEKANFLLGLSSDFWAGTLIGISVAAALFAIARLTRTRSAR